MKRILCITIIAFALSGCGHTETDLQNAYEEGKEKGYDQGYLEGVEKGKEEGYKEGYDACLQKKILE